MGFFDSALEEISQSSTTGSQSGSGHSAGITVSAGDDQNSSISITNEIIDPNLVKGSVLVAQDIGQRAENVVGLILDAGESVVDDLVGSVSTSIARLNQSGQANVNTAADLLRAVRVSQDQTFARGAELVKAQTAANERTLAQGATVLARAEQIAQEGLQRSEALNKATLATGERNLSKSFEVIKASNATSERQFDKNLTFARSVSTDSKSIFASALDFINTNNARGSAQVLDTLNNASSIASDLSTSEQAKLTEKIALGAMVLLGVMFVAPQLRGAFK